jgi:hypothetical protein
MVAFWDLPTSVLLGLIAANLEPLVRCSDGRWRSCRRGVPNHGLAWEDVEDLERGRLVECWCDGAVITDLGRTLLSSMRSSGTSLQTPARLTDREAHPSLQ